MVVYWTNFSEEFQCECKITLLGEFHLISGYTTVFGKLGTLLQMYIFLGTSCCSWYYHYYYYYYYYYYYDYYSTTLLPLILTLKMSTNLPSTRNGISLLYPHPVYSLWCQSFTYQSQAALFTEDWEKIKSFSVTCFSIFFSIMLKSLTIYLSVFLQHFAFPLNSLMYATVPVH